MKTIKYCQGCRNDFYNGKNELDVKRCWSLGKARLVTRYRISSSAPMNVREAYIRVKTPNCYHSNGYAYLDAIPPYARTLEERVMQETYKSNFKKINEIAGFAEAEG